MLQTTTTRKPNKLAFAILLVLLAFAVLGGFTKNAVAFSYHKAMPNGQNVSYGPYYEPKANFLIFDSGVPFYFFIQGNVQWNACLGVPCYPYNNVNHTVQDADVPEGESPGIPFIVYVFSTAEVHNQGGSLAGTIFVDNPNCLIPPYDSANCGYSNKVVGFSFTNRSSAYVRHTETAQAEGQVFGVGYNHYF